MIKRIIYLTGCASVFWGIYYLIHLIPIYPVKESKHDLSWGIAIAYGHLFYYILLLLSAFIWLVRYPKVRYILLVLSLLLYSSYWFPTFSVYPYKTLYEMALMLAVYIIMHRLLNAKFNQGKIFSLRSKVPFNTQGSTKTGD